MSQDRFFSSVDYEVACELLAAKSGALTLEIIKEKNKVAPDQDRINKLDAEAQDLWRQKMDLRPDDAEAIKRVFLMHEGQ